MIREFPIIVLWFSVAIGLPACAGNREATATPEPGASSQSAADRPRMRATLAPAPGQTVKGVGTRVSITIEDAEPGHVHPWHVHVGDCGSSGEIVGGGSAYPAIVISPAGDGKSTARLQIELGAGGDYFVNVHESPEDRGTIVACGEVEPR